MSSFEYGVDPKKIADNMKTLREWSQHFEPGEAEMMGWDLILKEGHSNLVRLSEMATSRVVEQPTRAEADLASPFSDPSIAV